MTETTTTATTARDTYVVEFVDARDEHVYDSFHGASADMAAGYLHLRDWNPAEAVKSYTENGSVVERDFNTFLIRVKREV